MRVLLVSANRERKPTPVIPLGVLWVAAAARREHQVRVVDLCFEDDPERALREAIAAFDPQAVGVGLRNLCDNAYEALDAAVEGYRRVARTVRAATSAPLILGGGAFSLQPERLLAELGADHGVIGEGEQLFSWLLGEIAAGRRPPRLLRAPAVSSGRSTPSHHLDAGRQLVGLPSPAYDLADARYFAAGSGDRTINVQSKRGCAFRCAYCDYPDLEGRMVRVREPAEVAEEIVRAAAVPGAAHLFLVDSVFNVPKAHALAVCREVSRRGAPLPWVCYVSPADVDAELVEAMAEAGCVGVEIGADTGTDATLRRLRKPFTRREIAESHRLFAAADIRDCHTFVLGACEESPAELDETLRFVSAMDPDVAVFLVFREDREEQRVGEGHARDRAAILETLRREAARHGGWVVPELGIRFGDRVPAGLSRRGVAGPTWLHWARLRRRAAQACG